MKRSIIKTGPIVLIGLVLFLLGCKGKNTVQENNIDVVKLSQEEIKSLSFSELFKAIDVKEIQEDVFTLLNEDYSVLTSGNSSH